MMRTIWIEWNNKISEDKKLSEEELFEKAK